MNKTLWVFVSIHLLAEHLHSRIRLFSIPTMYKRNFNLKSNEQRMIFFFSFTIGRLKMLTIAWSTVIGVPPTSLARFAIFLRKIMRTNSKGSAVQTPCIHNEFLHMNDCSVSRVNFKSSILIGKHLNIFFFQNTGCTSLCANCEVSFL